MVIEEGRLYFVKDEFLDKYGKKYNLMKNKLEGTKRPTYFCFRDDKEEDLLWFVPMSRQYQKYMNIYLEKKKKLKFEPNNFVFFDNLAGSKGVFLIQNMFPTKLKYIKQEYLRRGQKINITRKIQNSIKKKAKKVLKDTHKGKNVTYTNLTSFINEITKDI